MLSRQCVSDHHVQSAKTVEHVKDTMFNIPWEKAHNDRWHGNTQMTHYNCCRIFRMRLWPLLMEEEL